MIGTGGTVGTGGTIRTGGAVGTGGTIGTGGTVGTGGTTGSGGAWPVTPSGYPAAGASGQAPPTGSGTTLTILTWAGFKGAVTFTFDDANSSQIANSANMGVLGPDTNAAQDFLRIKFGVTACSMAGPYGLPIYQDIAIYRFLTNAGTLTLSSP